MGGVAFLPASMRTLIIDNGGDKCKVGLAGQEEPPRFVPNYGVRGKLLKHLKYADDVESLRDRSGLFYERSIEKGYVHNFLLQAKVWERCAELFKVSSCQ